MPHLWSRLHCKWQSIPERAISALLLPRSNHLFSTLIRLDLSAAISHSSCFKTLFLSFDCKLPSLKKRSEPKKKSVQNQILGPHPQWFWCNWYGGQPGNWNVSPPPIFLVGAKFKKHWFKTIVCHIPEIQHYSIFTSTSWSLLGICYLVIFLSFRWLYPSLLCRNMILVSVSENLTLT